jgi:hypothetical protein
VGRLGTVDNSSRLYIVVLQYTQLAWGWSRQSFFVVSCKTNEAHLYLSSFLIRTTDVFVPGFGQARAGGSKERRIRRWGDIIIVRRNLTGVGSGVLRPVVTGYLFFLLRLFAKTSYVRFVPASEHLGIASLFHD